MHRSEFEIYEHECKNLSFGFLCRIEERKEIVMKLIETKQAVGHVICHDITIIVKDKIKDTAFRKGHIVKEEDIPVLLSIGKDHLYVWEKDETMYHEDEAAVILADACEGKGMKRSNPKEGKIELTADCDGLFQVDVARLTAINSLEHMMIATRHTNTAVKKGDKLAGTRIIPLVIEKEKMKAVSDIAGKENPILKISPFVRKTAGIVLPGAMFLLGYFEDGTPIMGLPGCVMYAKATIFDLVLPRILADVPVTKKDLAVMGHGGLCLGCEVCHYPSCGFGKGV